MGFRKPACRQTAGKSLEIKRSDGLDNRQKEAIIALWNEEYPKDLSLSDLAMFDDYLEGLSDKHHLLLTDQKETVKGWLMYFMREGERFFAMLLHASLHGKGYGTKLLDEAKTLNAELNGWVIDNDEQQKQDGKHYRSPVGFYEKNGFEILREIQLKKKNINGIRVKWKAAGHE